MMQKTVEQLRDTVKESIQINASLDKQTKRAIVMVLDDYLSLTDRLNGDWHKQRTYQA